MSQIGKKLFLISFILAVITALIAFLYLKSLDNTDDLDVKKVKIIVATSNIPPRIIIESSMMEEIEVPKDSLFGDFIKDRKDIIGKYTKETILKGEKFRKDRLINELEEELSLRIKGSHRAISINTGGESGVADLIKPGDFVDIIVYLPELKESGRIIRPDLAKMILQNIEVLSIDKNLYRYSGDRLDIPVNFIVTLSVPVFGIEKLVLAEDIGDIELVLRPLDGDFIHETQGIIWQELLLDDFYKMKDMFPQYKIREIPGIRLNSDDYEYNKYYYYTIQFGDTLKKISTYFYGEPEKYLLIKQVNRILNEDEINAGTGIKIPVLEEN